MRSGAGVAVGGGGVGVAVGGAGVCVGLGAGLAPGSVQLASTVVKQSKTTMALFNVLSSYDLICGFVCFSTSATTSG